MRKTFYALLVKPLAALAVVWPACVNAANLETACYTIPLPATWSTVPHSIELATGLEGMEAAVSCVRLKGPPEPKDQRAELMRERLDNEVQYQRNYGSAHNMRLLQPMKRRKVDRFEAEIFSLFEQSDGTRFLRYAYVHERSAVVAEITYRPLQQEVVDRFIRDSLSRVRWKPYADWESAH